MKKITTLALFTLVIALPSSVVSWTNHALITYELVRGMPTVKNAPSVKAETLSTFLIKNAKPLTLFLARQEKWMRSHLHHYSARPEHLKFLALAMDKPDDIVSRFYQAIRINPNTLTPLYLQLMPGEKSSLKSLPNNIVSTSLNTSPLTKVDFVALKPDQMVKPLNVLISASNEPDHGMDIGLFDNNLIQNKSAIKKQYGFGQQPFGNDKVTYASQAPFHMGFYHEPSIINSLVPYVTKTYPEYRILLFKQLSEFAFKQGHDYWGWRFMGWGLHYIGDFSNPYHVSLMPGSDTFDMLGTGLLDSLGFEKTKNEVTQLLTNRHVIIEDFQNIKMTNDYLNQNKNSPISLAFNNKQEVNPQTFNYQDIINQYAKKGFDKSLKAHKVMMMAIPEQFVKDPEFDYANSTVRSQLLENMIKFNDEKSIIRMTNLIAELLSDYSSNGRAYIHSILKNKDLNMSFTELEDYK